MPEADAPRFSLSVGDGSGAMLGMAAGDSAGRPGKGGYAANTQQAVVVAYHLLRHGAVDRELLTGELLEMDGDDRDPSVFRDPSVELRRWLDTARGGEPDLSSGAGLDPSVRAVPIGMWHRRNPDDLVSSTLEVSRVTHLDAVSALLATATAGATAAACFAQNGRDLMMAIHDVMTKASIAILDQSPRYSGADQIDGVLSVFERAIGLVGEDGEALSGALGDGEPERLAAGLVLAAPVRIRPEAAIEAAAALGGSSLSSIVGAVVGARAGARVWPWPFPNESWFAALGMRLVEGRADLVDLPVPYAVEQRVSFEAAELPI